MLAYNFSNQFKKDLKQLNKRGKDLNKIYDIITSLIFNEHLPARCHEHKLRGDLEGFTECHIEGDWVLIYITDGEKIDFSLTETHSDYL